MPTIRFDCEDCCSTFAEPLIRDDDENCCPHCHSICFERVSVPTQAEVDAAQDASGEAFAALHALPPEQYDALVAQSNAHIAAMRATFEEINAIELRSHNLTLDRIRTLDTALEGIVSLARGDELPSYSESFLRKRQAGGM